MIAVKARIKRRRLEVQPVDDDDHPTGPPDFVDALLPEGLEFHPRLVQTTPPEEDEEQLFYVDDDAVPEHGIPHPEGHGRIMVRRCRPNDFPLRTVGDIDLPQGWPDVLPAGFGDSMVDAKGRLIPADPKTGKPLPDTSPTEARRGP